MSELDVGGVSGYAEFLAAITRASHAEHTQWMTWVGGDFDPNRFDAKAATKDMQRGLHDWRRLKHQREPLTVHDRQ
jgi:Plasmid pRiA4b ORF-3-like protein